MTIIMKNDVKMILSNYRGGITGVVIYLILSVIVYFIAFMTAFGNPSPTADMILDGVRIYASVANPLWSVPIAYLLGAYFIRKKQ